MYLPPLQPVSNSDIRISGDVQIHPTANIASGVIIQAAPNSSIVIDADVCIGMGAILHAHQGVIRVESGAMLGSGVLIVGSSQIGSNACIGTATTIFNASVPSMTVILPGSLIGDSSRQLIENSEDHQTNSSKPVESDRNQSESTLNQGQGHQVLENNEILEDIWLESSASSSPNNSKLDENNSASSIANSELNGSDAVEIEVDNKESETALSRGSVVGKVYINQLLLTLFPNSHSLNHNSPKETK